jgi:hypothetical protein
MIQGLWRRAGAASVLALALVGAVACTSSGDASKESDAVEEGAATTACTPTRDEKPAKALLRCGESSIVFIETLYATGTGVAVRLEDEDYVLTNLHVVDPFDSADVTLGGVEDLGRLPVAGVDVAADIALLGPIEDPGEDFEPVPLGDPSPEKGDDVFLVGFPGTADVEEADLTITAGLVSRLREADGWDQTYIQSDAVIGEGQSGGALFGADGQLLGISGLGYDPAFALSLQIQDVETAVDRILAGDGDDVIEVPQSADEESASSGDGATDGTVAFADDLESPTLFLPPSDEDRTWNLSVAGPEGRFAVTVQDGLSYEPVAANATGVALYDELVAAAAQRAGTTPEAIGVPPQDLPSDVVAREVSPGVFRIDVAAGDSAEVVFSIAPDAVPGSVTWTSDLPLWALTEELPVTTLEIGTPAEGIVGGYQMGVPFQVELTAGQEVKLSASSPQGDVALVVAAPGRRIDSFDVNLQLPDDALTFLDDSDEGLYGLDVLETFTADAAGTYQVWMQNYDYVPLAYRVLVSEPGGGDTGDGTTDDEGATNDG